MSDLREKLMPKRLLTPEGAALPPTAGSHRRFDPLELVVRALQAGPVLILVVICAVFTLLSNVFLTEDNIKNVLIQASPIALLAIGQLVVIVSRGIDLSVGSTIALVSVVGVQLATSGSSALVVILVMIAVGAAVGAINGGAISFVGIANPFIVTLGMLSVVSGVALIISDGQTKTGMPEVLQSLGKGEFAGVPYAVWLFAVVALVVGTALSATKYGRWVYAIGGNPDSAQRVGIPVKKVVFAVYVVSGLCAGIAGIVVAGRANAGFPTAGQGAELEAISAVVIGGASFFGGRGNVINALVGALMLAVIHNGLNLVGISPDWQIVAIGLILILAVGSDYLRANLETRLRSHYAKEL